MGTIEIISLIVNFVTLGGFVTLLTIKSAKAKAEAEAESVELDNEEKVNKMVREYFVEPLKKEMTALRREITRFRNAVERIPECPHSAECPVKESLKDSENNHKNDIDDNEQ